MNRAAKSKTASRVIACSKRYYIIPGGVQNASSCRLYRKSFAAIGNSIKIRGVFKTLQKFHEMSEFGFGETCGVLKGVDRNGNRYYENLDNQIGRHRWVEYARRDIHGRPDASMIAPEWHGWMHCMFKIVPGDKDFPQKPKWLLRWEENPTMTDKRYLPTNFGQKTFKNSYQSWDYSKVSQTQRKRIEASS